MAGMSFVEFADYIELENYCKQKKLYIIPEDGFSIKARIVDENKVKFGYVSDRPHGYKPVKPETKYVLVWE